MQYVQTFIFAGTKLGEAFRKGKQVHEELQRPANLLFYCGNCGLVYAKCPILCFSLCGPWQSIKGCCMDCTPTSQFEVPGSIWITWDEDFLLALPMPVLEQELKRHLDWKEKGP